jgi:Domain of unknown function (DUF4160)
MPTVFVINGFRFFFYSNENDEPVHIHVEKAEDAAKFWLNPVELEYNYGFSSRELKQIESIVKQNSNTLIVKWNEYFNK